MITIDEMEVMLNEITEGFPRGLIERLNGGIVLLPDVKLHEKNRNNDLFILGEYHYDHVFGRYISIYYGSFMRVHGRLGRDELKDRLEATLKHEFTHHLESLAGEKGLEIKDSEDISKYLRS